MALTEEEFKTMINAPFTIVTFNSATKPDNKTRLGTYWYISGYMWFVGVAINDRGHVINERIIYERVS